MSIHWRALNADAKIEAIKTVWRKGISASQIAAHFEGVTRNAVIGVYNRYRDKLADAPLEGRGGPCTPGTSKRDRRPLPWEKTVKVRENRWPTFSKRLVLPGTPRGKVATPPTPLPAPRVYAEEQQLAGRPLMMLRAQECKWAVNSAAKGEQHLFCGLSAEGPYCAHHAMRSVAERRT